MSGALDPADWREIPVAINEKLTGRGDVMLVLNELGGDNWEAVGVAMPP